MDSPLLLTHAAAPIKAGGKSQAKVDIVELLKPPAQVAGRSAEIERAIERLRSRHTEAVADLERLEASTKSIYLADDDDAAERHDRELGAARRKVDRFVHHMGLAEAELKVAKEGEAKAALQAHAESIAKAVEIMVQRLDAIYAPAAAAIAAFAADWKATGAAVDQLNRTLAASGMLNCAPQRPEATRRVPVEKRREPYKTQIVWTNRETGEKRAQLDHPNPAHHLTQSWVQDVNGAWHGKQPHDPWQRSTEVIEWTEVEVSGQPAADLLWNLSLPVVRGKSGGDEFIHAPRRRWF